MFAVSDRSLFILGALVFHTGCLSLGSSQRASALGRGANEFSVETNSHLLGREPLSSATVREVLVPVTAVRFTHGVTDRVDVGGRLGWLSAELHVKTQLTPSSSPWVISLMPTAGAAYLSDGYARSTTYWGVQPYWFAQLPVLLGYRLADGSEWVFGPRVAVVRAFNGSATQVYAGTSLGFSWQATDWFALMPELTATVPLLSQGTAVSPTLNSWLRNNAQVTFNLGFNFDFGRSKSASAAATR